MIAACGPPPLQLATRRSFFSELQRESFLLFKDARDREAMHAKSVAASAAAPIPGAGVASCAPVTAFHLI